MLPDDPKETRRVVNMEWRTRYLYRSYTLSDLMRIKQTMEELIEERTIGVLNL
jgi:hypothetical protein